MGDGVGQISKTFDSFKKAVCLFTRQKIGMAETGYLNGIFLTLWGFKGVHLGDR